MKDSIKPTPQELFEILRILENNKGFEFQDIDNIKNFWYCYGKLEIYSTLDYDIDEGFLSLCNHVLESF